MDVNEHARLFNITLSLDIIQVKEQGFYSSSTFQSQ